PMPPSPVPPPFPYTTLFRSRNTGEPVPPGNCDVVGAALVAAELRGDGRLVDHRGRLRLRVPLFWTTTGGASKPGPRRVRDLKRRDRKSTRLNSSHVKISYAV